MVHNRWSGLVLDAVIATVAHNHIHFAIVYSTADVSMCLLCSYRYLCY